MSPQAGTGMCEANASTAPENVKHRPSAADVTEGGDLALLESGGRRAFAGFRLQSLGQVSSTQDVVRQAARAGAAEGYCCMAVSQSAGRGRQDRSWTAAAGTSLLASVLVRMDGPVAGCVPMVAGLALRAAITATSGCECHLKWPNDVLVGVRKLAGILCEVEPGAPGDGTAVVVGVGVNLGVPSFPPGMAAVSLHELVATPPSAPRLLAAFLDELALRLPRLSEAGLGPLRAEWTVHAAGLGDLVTATSNTGSVTGVALGIDDDGALLLRTTVGVVRVLAADVHLAKARPSGSAEAG